MERVGFDKNVGKFTYVSFYGRSLGDYVLASKDMLSLFDNFTLHESSVYPDHCTLSTTLSVESESYKN